MLFWDQCFRFIMQIWGRWDEWWPTFLNSRADRDLNDQNTYCCQNGLKSTPNDLKRGYLCRICILANTFVFFLIIIFERFFDKYLLILDIDPMDHLDLFIRFYLVYNYKKGGEAELVKWLLSTPKVSSSNPRKAHTFSKLFWIYLKCASNTMD